MNKILKLAITLIVVVIVFTNISCKKFDTLPLNIPFSIGVTIEGSNNPSVSNTPYCLSESETYDEYRDRIKKLVYIEAAWRTDSVRNISSATISITIKISGGAVLFQRELPSTNPSVFKSTPYILKLTSEEIQKLNSYLYTYLKNSTPCLESSVEVTIAGGLPPYYLKGYIDLVVEAETEL